MQKTAACRRAIEPVQTDGSRLANDASESISRVRSNPYWRHESHNNLAYCLEGVPIHYVFEGSFVAAALQDRPHYLLLRVSGLVLQQGCTIGLRELRAQTFLLHPIY